MVKGPDHGRAGAIERGFKPLNNLIRVQLRQGRARDEVDRVQNSSFVNSHRGV